MTITLPAEIEAVLVARARLREATPEQLAVATLRDSLLPDAGTKGVVSEEHEKWIALVKRIGRPCGVAVPDEALSSDGLYD